MWAQGALEHAERHAEAIEQQGPIAELMRQLAAVERAVAEGAGRAPDLHALRNAIGDLWSQSS